jgi:MoaA/NifB/PqqE/SkfB family radical SAM enzyme
MSFTAAKLVQFSKIYLRPKDVNYLILYVTSHCNQKCEFCFYADSLNAPWGHGMSLEQLEKVSKSLPNCIHVTMTGGEPFLRTDLPQIVDTFCTNSKTINITFPTNGSMPERTAEMLEKMLKAQPQCVFRVALSIDALKEKHDEIRKMKGAFEKAEQTFHLVKKLQNKYSNLVLVINSVASKYNKNELVEFIDYAIEHLWCDDHSLLLARGNTKQIDAKDISYQEYADIVLHFEKKKAEKKQADTLYKKLLKHIETKTREVVTKSYTENSFIMPCVAGKKLLVLYDSGELSPCEILDTMDHSEQVRKEYGNFAIGNVKDFDFDISKMLATERSQKINQFIQDTKCHCTFECAIAASLTMKMGNLPKLLNPKL